MDQQDSDDVTAEQLHILATYWYWRGYQEALAANQQPYLFTHN